jgi:hypothetical protein
VAHELAEGDVAADKAGEGIPQRCVWSEQPLFDRAHRGQSDEGFRHRVQRKTVVDCSAAIAVGAEGLEAQYAVRIGNAEYGNGETTALDVAAGPVGG